MLNAQQQAIVDAGAALALQADLTGHYPSDELVRRQTFEASSGVPKFLTRRVDKRMKGGKFGEAAKVPTEGLCDAHRDESPKADASSGVAQ
jgi:hypothetical protein